MSGFFRCQVRIPMDSGTPEDDVINVWHFDSDQTFAEDADDVFGRLSDFYQAIDSIVFPARVSSTAHVKIYDLADPEPRVPGFEDDIPLSTTADNVAIPNEVAMCLSMAADPVSGVAPGRLRGRIFLGPVASTAMTVVGGRVRFAPTAMLNVVTAAQTLAVGPDPGDARLAVFSPTIHAAEGGTPADLDAAFHDVTRLWIDNAPDTIRSRGERADARETVTVP